MEQATDNQMLTDSRERQTQQEHPHIISKAEAEANLLPLHIQMPKRASTHTNATGYYYVTTRRRQIVAAGATDITRHTQTEALHGDRSITCKQRH